MSATDAMLARFQSELEERRTFMDGLIEAAESAGRDLTAEETDLYTRARDRMRVIAGQMEPLQEGARIAIESRPDAPRSLSACTPTPAARRPRTSSTARLAPTSPTCTTRSSATPRRSSDGRSTTAPPPIRRPPTTPGLLPETIVSPIVNFIEVARPICATLGPTGSRVGCMVVSPG